MALTIRRHAAPQQLLIARTSSKTERTWYASTVLAAGLLILAASLSASGAELNGDTLKAWGDYVCAQKVRLTKSPEATSFLWSEQSPDRMRRLRSGEILISPVGESPRAIPQGLIHHWVGAMFLPEIRLDDVLAVVRDYNEYKDFYAPNVIRSKVLPAAGLDDAFSLRMLNQSLLSKFALDADFHNSYTPIDQNRWYSVGYSTRIREIDDYGQADEHELPANTGRGFIWRLYSVSRFEQRDGGVYVELETIALSRDVPGALRWVVNPIVRRVSKNSMLVSLQNTQGAVLAKNHAAKKNDDLAQDASFPTKLPSSPVSSGFLPF